VNKKDRQLMDLWDGDANPTTAEDRAWLGLRDELKGLQPKVTSRVQFDDVMREVRLAGAQPQRSRRPWWLWAVPSAAVATAGLYFVVMARPDAVPEPGANRATIDNLSQATPAPQIPDETTTPAPATSDPAPKVETTTPRPETNVRSTAPRSNRRPTRRNRPADNTLVAANIEPVSSREAEMSPMAMADVPSRAHEARASEVPAGDQPTVVVVSGRPSASTGLPKATEAPLTDVVFGG